MPQGGAQQNKNKKKNLHQSQPLKNTTLWKMGKMPTLIKADRTAVATVGHRYWHNVSRPTTAIKSNMVAGFDGGIFVLPLFLVCRRVLSFRFWVVQLFCVCFCLAFSLPRVCASPPSGTFAAARCVCVCVFGGLWLILWMVHNRPRDDYHYEGDGDARHPDWQHGPYHVFFF